ncbi:hypothetical protein LMG14418_0513 [Lactococcus lactis subsp. lactis]|nr:hypothetical protein LMG14418_0513 [Lactococcus lactis subsp. lactis]
MEIFLQHISLLFGEIDCSILVSQLLDILLKLVEDSHYLDVILKS